MSQKQLQHVLRCAKGGYFDPLKTALEENVDFSNLIYPISGDSILHVAASLGTPLDLRLILRHFNKPSLVNYRNKDGKTPLHEACQFSRKDNVRVLLDEGADVNAIKRADWSPLMLACAKTQEKLSVDIVKMLLEKGALMNLSNKDGWSALHLVSRDGNVNVFRVLVDGGAVVDSVTKNGRTIFHIAALHGNIDIIKEILKGKPKDMDVKDNCGNTPLHEAVLGNHIDICRLLIESGSQTTITNSVGYGLLHFAASVGSVEMICYLVSEVKCDVNSTARTEVTPLHCAARKGYKETYEVLVMLGADEDVKDNFGRTANDYLNT